MSFLPRQTVGCRVLHVGCRMGPSVIPRGEVYLYFAAVLGFFSWTYHDSSPSLLLLLHLLLVLCHCVWEERGRLPSRTSQPPWPVPNMNQFKRLFSNAIQCNASALRFAHSVLPLPTNSTRITRSSHRRLVLLLLWWLLCSTGRSGDMETIEHFGGSIRGLVPRCTERRSYRNAKESSRRCFQRLSSHTSIHFNSFSCKSCVEVPRLASFLRQPSPPLPPCSADSG